MHFEKNQLKLLKTVLEEIEDYAILSMDLNGNIETWNKGAEKIKGYTPSEIIGRNFSVFYTTNDRLSALPATLLNNARLSGKAYHEGWRVRKNHSTFWGAVTITAQHDDRGDVIGYTKITRDLTNQMLSQATISRQLQELSSKNKELEQFVYIASHDLQEPLLTVTNFLDLIRQEYEGDLDETLSMYLNVVYQSTTRMRALIKGLLDYARIGQRVEFQEVDCMGLINDIRTDMLATLAESGAVIECDTLPVIIGYPIELRQLFQNLIANAIKFRKKDVLPVVRIHAKEDINSWIISVSDNGIGIDPIFRQKIFMIFQRLHSRDDYEGNGIGLAHCKKIAEVHGGSLEVESEPGKGSTFHFRIPFRNID